MALDVVGDVGEAWEIEQIPDDATLYMRVHRDFFSDGRVMLGVFRDQGGGMSTDWHKYSTPVQTSMRAKTPKDNAVISLSVGKVRAILGITVMHDPLPDNRAHTNIIGDKKAPEVRVKLGRICQIILELGPS